MEATNPAPIPAIVFRRDEFIRKTIYGGDKEAGSRPVRPETLPSIWRQKRFREEQTVQRSVRKEREGERFGYDLDLSVSGRG